LNDRRPNRHSPLRLEFRVRLSTNVPKLQTNLGALCMDRFYDLLPTGYLRVIGDARRCVSAIPSPGDEGGLANHQAPLGGSLCVILRHQVTGHVARYVSAHPGEWREHYAVREVECADLDWRKQRRHLNTFTVWMRSSSALAQAKLQILH
jgi:hypothetical protein